MSTFGLPQSNISEMQFFGPVSGSSGGFQTFGTWQECAILEYDISGIWLTAFPPAASYGANWLQLGKGTAGNETILCTNNVLGRNTDRQAYFPLYMKKGDRLSMRVRGDNSGTEIQNVHGWLVPASSYSQPSYIQGSTTILANTVTPGSTGAWGTWAQIIASTTYEAKAISFSGYFDDTSARFLKVQLGFGAASSETTIVEQMFYLPGFTSGLSLMSAPVPIKIPAGTRISARASSDNSVVSAGVICINLWR